MDAGCKRASNLYYGNVVKRVARTSVHPGEICGQSSRVWRVRI